MVRSGSPFKLLLLALAILAALACIAVRPAHSKRCTGTCGDASTFDRPASTSDACRVMVCPRTCRTAGVTTCLWCGQTAGIPPQAAQFTATVRLGLDPNNPGAPTGPVQGTGQGTLGTGAASEPGGGTIRVTGLKIGASFACAGKSCSVQMRTSTIAM